MNRSTASQHNAAAAHLHHNLSGGGGSASAIGCNTCAERGFVTKTATPRFPHKQPIPEPDFVCHGCVERAAILSEVSSLREMVLALSNGMLELNNTCSEQKRRISALESQLSATQAATTKVQQEVDRAENRRQHQYNLASGDLPRSGGGGSDILVGGGNSAGAAGSGTAATTATGLSGLVEKMLHNNSLAIEARIASNVRAAESDRSVRELKSIREEVSRKVAEVQRDVDRRLTQLDSKWSMAESQQREAVSAHERRINRAIFQMCEVLGIAAPPAASVSD